MAVHTAGARGTSVGHGFTMPPPADIVKVAIEWPGAYPKLMEIDQVGNAGAVWGCSRCPFGSGIFGDIDGSFPLASPRLCCLFSNSCSVVGFCPPHKGNAWLLHSLSICVDGVNTGLAAWPAWLSG